MSISRESRRATPSYENAVPVMHEALRARRAGVPPATATGAARRRQRERRERDVAREHERELAQDPVPGDPLSTSRP